MRNAAFTVIAIALCGCGCDGGGVDDDVGPDLGLDDGGTDSGGNEGLDDAGVPEDAADVDPDDGNVADADDAGDVPDPECPRLPGPEDAPRAAVVSHPYDSAAAASGAYERLDLAVDGTLSRPGVSFTMRRAFSGGIVFTPDGEVGLVAQDDGTLGVFRVEPDGSVTVVHEGFDGSFHAASVVMDPVGDGAWVLDTQWREHGGGIYRIGIGCDGTVRDEGLVAAAKMPWALAPHPTEPAWALVAARDLLDAMDGDDTFLLARGAAPSVLSSVRAFPDDEQYVSSAAITSDGRWFLMGDNGMFSVPNGIAVVGLDSRGFRSTSIVAPIEDPVSIAVSPWDDAVLVSSGLGDALVILDYDPLDASEPFVDAGEVTYAGGRPELPDTSVVVSRGSLRGLVLVAEVSGVRRLRFDGDGTVTDLGRFGLGAGYENIVGALGLQP
jgi:hypothetical protein